MAQLTKIYRIRLSDSDIEKIELLKQNSINASRFIRKAFSESFKSDFPKIMAEITKKQNKTLPF